MEVTLMTTDAQNITMITCENAWTDHAAGTLLAEDFEPTGDCDEIDPWQLECERNYFSCPATLWDIDPYFG